MHVSHLRMSVPKFLASKAMRTDRHFWPCGDLLFERV
jgi:hypothetical protein